MQEDVASTIVGNQVPIIQYNNQTKQYTVGTVSVVEKNHETLGTYHIMSGPVTLYQKSTDDTDKSYEAALKHYNELTEELKDH